MLLIQAGTIGKIKEVHSWCRNPGVATPLLHPLAAIPSPAAWIGTFGWALPTSGPYIGNSYYHPNNWRKRLDFGTGTFGDMGCHIFDPVFSALELKAPIAIRSEGSPPSKWNWALDSRINYTFAGTPFTAEKTIQVHWYDGEQKLPDTVISALEGDEPANTGSVFIGTHGSMLLPHVSRPILYPDKKFATFQMPEVEAGDHWLTFVDACLGRPAQPLVQLFRPAHRGGPSGWRSLPVPAHHPALGQQRSQVRGSRAQ